MESGNPTNLFLRLSISECKNRFFHLSQSKQSISILSPSGNISRSILLDFYVKESAHGNVHLELFVDPKNIDATVSPIFVAIKHGAELLLAKGDVITGQDQNEVKITITSGVFKKENRSSPRITTFPLRRAFVFFDLLESTSDPGTAEVVFMNRVSSDHHMNMIQDFLKKRELYYGKSEQLSGFRVIDLSHGGAAFLVNKKEAIPFVIGRFFDNIVIEMNGKRFTIGRATVVHTVDYIGGITPGITMCKVGIMFNNSTLPSDWSSEIDNIIAIHTPDANLQQELEKCLPKLTL